MRGRNPWTAMLPRVSLILNYEEQDINLCLVCSQKHRFISMLVGTDVLGGPMSHRSQIAYLSIAKIKIIYGNNIFAFCLRTAEDVGPYKFDIIFMFRQQTNVRRRSLQSLPQRGKGDGLRWMRCPWCKQILPPCGGRWHEPCE